MSNAYQVYLECLQDLEDAKTSIKRSISEYRYVQDYQKFWAKKSREDILYQQNMSLLTKYERDNNLI